MKVIILLILFVFFYGCLTAQTDPAIPKNKRKNIPQRISECQLQMVFRNWADARRRIETLLQQLHTHGNRYYLQRWE